MVLRLDPRLPLLWRTPSSLQFGVDAPRVVLEEVSGADERMIAALRVGVSRSGLEMIAASAGGGHGEVGLLLDRLGPALVPATDAAPQGRVTIVGDGPAAEHIAHLLRRSNVAVVPDGDETALVVIVAGYVIPPGLHGRWLGRDLPHLPVVFGDEAVRLGPLVEPGIGPCLWCVELARTDADPAWPAIATQLLGRRPTAESALLVEEVAVSVARLVLARIAPPEGREPGPRGGSATSLAIGTADGARRSTVWWPHPDCLCGASGGIDSVEGVSPARRGIVTVGERRPGRLHRSTTTGAVGDGPA
ncbi:hypothetical protein [Lacisediminihabitans profunda]|uniref:TOMM leader peptide-binding protein n=1 Tax=Lacisediminihabitans profunda TaxID=2594790 RepID=A0A5C8UUG3_9MICO|nr:hypothetical protein [Lacisediminihabitans profunda]TXN31229.1 hypothetical protein FVP33_06550 [Lacisediminihabitans profunda]